MPWGDYGSILLTGMTTRPDESGRIGIERTGPFVPPITVMGISDVVVTDAFRMELERSELQGFGFAPTVVKRVVRLDWRSWDITAPEPLRYPAGGEPENYILGRKHVPALVDEIGPLWEVTIEEVLESPGSADFVRSAPTKFSRIYVSDVARSWLEQHAGDWLRMEAEHT